MSVRGAASLRTETSVPRAGSRSRQNLRGAALRHPLSVLSIFCFSDFRQLLFDDQRSGCLLIAAQMEINGLALFQFDAYPARIEILVNSLAVNSVFQIIDIEVKE